MFVPATAHNWLVVVVAAGHLYLTPRDLASCNWADHRHLTTGIIITRNKKLAALECVYGVSQMPITQVSKTSPKSMLFEV